MVPISNAFALLQKVSNGMGLADSSIAILPPPKDHISCDLGQPNKSPTQGRTASEVINEVQPMWTLPPNLQIRGITRESKLH